MAPGRHRKAVVAAGAIDVDGLLVHPDDTDPVDVPEPTAALLPALDPTPMGWKQRDCPPPSPPGSRAPRFRGGPP